MPITAQTSPSIATTYNAPNKRKRWWLFILVISFVSLAFRYYYLIHAQVLQPVGDGVEYYAYAYNLAHHGVFTQASDRHLPLLGDSYRDPGYPCFLALWMKWLPNWNATYAAILLSQGLLSTLSVILVLWLARTWMSFPWLVAAGVLMAVWPHSVTSSGYILSETLYGFLCLLALLLLDLALRRRSAWLSVIGGMGFALSALTNAVLLPFAPFIGICLAIRGDMSRRMLLGFLLGATFLPGAWMVRNAALPPGKSASTRAIVNFVQGSWPSYHQIYQQVSERDPAGVANMARIDREVDLMRTRFHVGMAEIMERLNKQPLHYVTWYFSKPALLWAWDIRVGQGDLYIFPTHHSAFDENSAYRAIAAICHALNPWLLVAMLAAMGIGLRQRNELEASLLPATALLIFVTLVYTLLQAEPRYSIPYKPLEIVLAMFALAHAYEWLAPVHNQAAGRNTTKQKAP